MAVQSGSQAARRDEFEHGPEPVACNDSPGASVRFMLRDRTRSMHEATEESFAAYDLSREEHYRRFLLAHASALPRLELGVTGLGWTAWHPRLPRLVDDLAALGLAMPAPLLAPVISPVAAWGVQYVMEGSRLGGRVLAQRVPAGLPIRYLSPDPDMSARWQAFCAALDAEASRHGPDWREEIVDAAIETFQTFRRAALAQAGDLP